MNRFQNVFKNNKILINSVFNGIQRKSIISNTNSFKTLQSATSKSITNGRLFTNTNKSNFNTRSNGNHNNNNRLSFEFKNKEWNGEKKQQYFKSSNKSNLIYIIIGVNVATYVYMNSDESYSFQRYIGKNFMLSTDNFASQPLTLLTSFFAHKDGTHLLFNMLALYSLGPHVLYTIGASSFFALYMASGIFSGLGFLAIQKYYNEKSGSNNFWSMSQRENTRALGASGAISGVLCVFGCMFPRMTLNIYGILPVPAAILVGGYIAYDLYNEVYRRQTGVCHVGHLAGALTGILYYLLHLRGRY